MIVYPTVRRVRAPKALKREVQVTAQSQLILKRCFTADILREQYSYLSNSREGWNKRGGSAKVAKSTNEEVGINVEGGIFWKKTST